MDNENGIKRREFLKAGLVGTAVLASHPVAGIASLYAADQPPVMSRRLGRTGMQLAVIGFGANQLSEPEVLRFALDHGVNYVDTARRYLNGRSEEIIGKAIKGRRDKVYVATKARITSKTRDDVIRDVEESLKALGTDYIDVIQLHETMDRARIYDPELREAFTILKKQGKVRFFGVGTHTNQVEVLNAMVEDPEKFFDMALVAYNFLGKKELSEAIERTARADIGIIAMKTQAGGYKIDPMANPHQAALRWALQNPHITAAIPGMKDLAQVRENVSVMVGRVAAADQQILSRYAQAVQPYYCHLCDECRGTCPQGVGISTINRALMYAEGYGNLEMAKAAYAGATVSAVGCLDCAGCRASCANGLDIAAKMGRARELLG